MRPLLAVLIFAGSIAACGGSDSTEPNAGVATVTQVGLFWGNGPTPCQSNVTMTFTVQVLNAKVDDDLVVQLTGPGLATFTQKLTASSQLVTKQFPVTMVAQGQAATWNALVVSVGGQKPDSVSGGRTTATSFVSC